MVPLKQLWFRPCWISPVTWGPEMVAIRKSEGIWHHCLSELQCYFMNLTPEALCTDGHDVMLSSCMYVCIFVQHYLIHMDIGNSKNYFGTTWVLSRHSEEHVLLEQFTRWLSIQRKTNDDETELFQIVPNLRQMVNLCNITMCRLGLASKRFPHRV